MTTQQYGQIYKPLHQCNCVHANARGDDVASHLDGGSSYGASSSDMMSYLGFIRLWLACLTESFTGNINKGFEYLRAFEAKALQDAADIASGKTRAPALIPESARAPDAPKIMLNRRAKRILARGLPACRQYGWFRFASPRTLTGNQFFELVAKLSVNGRVGVYRLEYKTRLCCLVHLRERNCTEAMNIRFRQNPSLVSFSSISFGLSDAHIWPDW